MNLDTDLHVLLKGSFTKYSQSQGWLGWHYYNPFSMNHEYSYTNIILKKIVGDPYFEWYGPREISRSNSFGKTQLCDNGDGGFDVHAFEKLTTIEVEEGVFNFGDDKRKYSIVNNVVTSNPLTDCNQVMIANFWIVVDNPNNSKLYTLTDDILFGGCMWKVQYKSTDIENDINVLAHVFQVDGVSYKNGKIYIPMILPYNCLILNNMKINSGISVYKNGTRVNFEVWANVGCPRIYRNCLNRDILHHYQIFHLILHDKCKLSSVNHDISSMCHQYPEECSVIIFKNISRENVLSIKLYNMSFEENNIEWIGNSAIYWINKSFLLPNHMHKNLNFRKHKRKIIIDNTYSKEQDIEISFIRTHVIRALYSQQHPLLQ